MLLHRYQLTIRMTEKARLPEYKGSMFRGAFGWAFRNAVCVTRAQECTGCLLQSVCSYFRVFETEVPPDNTVPFMNGVRKMPHPYILLPPLETRRDFSAGDEMIIGLSLLGETAKMLPYFIYSFQQMGQAGIGHQRRRFRLSSVRLLTPEESSAELLREGESSITLIDNPVDLNALPNFPVPDKVTLRFITPYRAQESSVIITNPENITPELILNAVRRRYIVISSLYGNGPGMSAEDLTVDDISVSENRLRFTDWERYSNRQQTKMSMGGMTGTITLKGNLTSVWNLLKIGEYIHIGKNAAFGLGKYEMEKT